MRGQRGVLRHIAAFVFLLGLLAGSFQSASAMETGEANRTTSTAAHRLLQPEGFADVSFSVTVASPYVLDTLPAGTTWTISGTANDGSPVDLSGTLDAAQTLPYTFLAAEQVPYGTYVMTFDPTDQYEFVSRAIEVSAPGTTVAIELFPILESQVTLNLSSSDPSLAGTMPEGASWTISSTSGGEVVASGTFTPEQLQLPSSVALADAVPFGEYLVTIAATWAFEPYERVHVIDSPIQALDVVLTPYVEQPVSTTLSLVADDGVERDVELHLKITDAETLEVVADESIDATVPGAIWTGDLVPGDYWVTIDAGANYLAISEPFTVIPRVPNASFEFILNEIGPDPTATPPAEPTSVPFETPTADPSVTPAAEPTQATKETKKSEVTTLPSTGQGDDSGSGGAFLALVLGSISLLLLAAGYAWRQRRIAA